MAIRKFAMAVLGFALCGQLVWSQVNTGTISGTVRDASGAVLPGASVAVLNQDTGITRTVTSNAAGRYAAPALSLGNYQVTTQLAGFQTSVRSGVVLTVGSEQVIDVTLQVGAVTQTVEVTGEAPLIELSNANLGGLVNDEVIRDMPLNSRSWDTLAYTVPGVVKYGAAGGGFNSGSGANKFSVSGARSYSNSFLLDGTDANDSSNSTPGGSAGTNLGVDTIKEFKIVASQFSAEYGRASGAVVSAVTRSGTNELHGSAFEFLRNSAFDARGFFDSTDLNGDGKADLPPFRRNQFGGTLGGPILRDKTFFFGGYEGLRQARSNTILAKVPTVAAKQGNLVSGRITVAPEIVPYLALYPDPQRILPDPATGAPTDIGEYTQVAKNVVRQDYFMGRVDHQLTGSTNIFGRYQFDDDKNVGVTANNEIVRDVDEAENARRMYATLQANTVISPTLVNSARFAFNRSAQFQDAFAVTDLANSLTYIPGKLMGTLTIGEARGDPVFAEVGSDTGFPRFWVWNNWEWGDDMTWSKDRHTFKWGGVIKRWQNNNTVQSESRGQYTFEGLRNMLLGNVNQFRGVPIGEEGYKGIRITQMGFYFQDDFRVTPRLTLNMGLRWETATDPTEANNQVSNLLDALDADVAVHPRYALPGQKTIDALFITGDKNFQPRFGFAYQMNDRATRVIRGGFGIYHDLTHPFLFNQQASKYPPFFHRLQVDATEQFRVPFPTAAPLLSVANVAAIQMEPMWPVMPMGTKVNFNLTIQQSWGSRGVFEIGYVGSQASHITRYQQLNYPNYEIINGEKYFPGRGLTSANCITTSSPNRNCWATSITRRNPAFNRIRTKTNDSNSHYNGLQMKLQRTFASGPQFSLAYTFSKVMDQQGGLNNGDNGSRDTSSGLDPHDSARDWGLAGHDARHVLSSSFSYPLPLRFTGRAANALLGGWEITGTSLAMSGQPLTPQLQTDFSRTGNAGSPDRPDLLPGRSANPTSGVTATGERLGTADRWYDPTAFTWPNPLGLPIPQLGFFGNIGRNTIVGPKLVNFDLAIFKRFSFTENTSLQFRAEFFNIFNTANLGIPIQIPLLDEDFRTNLRTGKILYNPSGGQITETSTENREIQFGLKFIF
jgi:hypothetical protein